MIQSLVTIFDAVANIILPPLCAHCKLYLDSPQDIFCSLCAGAIKPIAYKRIEYAQNKELIVHAAGAYEYPLKGLILAKQFRYAHAGTIMGKLVWQSCAISIPFDYIVPIPLHWLRNAQRGYNQTALMANVIAQKSGKPVVHLLTRHKKTKFQQTLAAPERRLNLEDAFSLNYHLVTQDLKDKQILLVDDLMTTGSTLISAARTLKTLQPRSLSAVVTCRVV